MNIVSVHAEEEPIFAVERFELIEVEGLKKICFEFRDTEDIEEDFWITLFDDFYYVDINTTETNIPVITDNSW